MIQRFLLLFTALTLLAGCPIGPAGKPDYLAGTKEVLTYKPLADAVADSMFARWKKRQKDAAVAAKGQTIYDDAKQLFDEGCASTHEIVALVAAKKKDKTELAMYCKFQVVTDADLRRCIHARIAALGAALLRVALTIDDLVQATKQPASQPISILLHKLFDQHLRLPPGQRVTMYRK